MIGGEVEGAGEGEGEGEGDGDGDGMGNGEGACCEGGRSGQADATRASGTAFGISTPLFLALIKYIATTNSCASSF